MGINEEKLRRMELRKENGTRVITRPESPPEFRGPEYLIAHACFSCRKSFKQPVEDSEIERVCPECGTQIYEMGRSFKPPKSSDLKQWKKVRLLYAEGFRFFGCGSRSGEKLPEKLIDLEKFLNDNPTHPLKVAKPNYSLKEL